MSKNIIKDLVLIDENQLSKSGIHALKNGWRLIVGEYDGHYEINKPEVYGIWATRDTGGQFGDGVWTIRLIVTTDKIEIADEDKFITVSGGFDIETCDKVIDRMKVLMLKYNIKDYSNRIKNFKYAFKKLRKKKSF